MSPVIQTSRLAKSYGPLLALKGLDLSVERGTVCGLLGANGAGKSTAIACMLGLQRPSSGAVQILGQDPQIARKQLFKQVGVQLQETSFQEKITAEELCQVSAALYHRPHDYRQLLAQFGLADKAGRPVKELSGGQRQKLFITLALLPNPQVVFLDELTTGLDPRARQEVWAILSSLKASGVTILLTSHFMDEVEALCDHICILKHGKTVFSGTVDQAVADSPYTAFEDAYLWYTEEDR